MKIICDVSTLIKGDIIRYINRVDKEFIIDEGKLKQDNQHNEGVEVYGDIDGKEWVQYVSKYFIREVIRDGESIFKIDDME